jgi:hypothetical protein
MMRGREDSGRTTLWQKFRPGPPVRKIEEFLPLGAHRSAAFMFMHGFVSRPLVYLHTSQLMFLVAELVTLSCLAQVSIFLHAAST